MKARGFALAIAIVAAGCSSDGEPATSSTDAAAAPPASGGAMFALRGPACPDDGTTITLAKADADGSLTLHVDGFDGALVSCRLDAAEIAASVATDAGRIEVRGGFTGPVSVRATVGRAGRSYKSDRCSVDWTERGGDGRVFGYVTCDALALEGGAAGCAFSGAGDKAYFRFANCLRVE